MAYSHDTPTYTHLDQVAKFFRLNMLNFQDLDITPCVPDFFIDRRCARFAQWNYQSSGLIAIEDIAYYLKLAEDTIQTYLPYSIDNGFSSTIIEVPRHYSGDFRPRLIEGMKLISNTKCISEFGVPVIEMVGLTDLLVLFSSESGLFIPDGYNEYFVATITLPVDFDTANMQYLYLTHPDSYGEKDRRVPVVIQSYDEDTRELIVRGDSHNIIKLEYIFDASYTRTRGIDVCDDDIYETELEIWVERADDCAPYAYLLCEDERIPLKFDIFDMDDGIIQYMGYGRTDDEGCFVEDECITTPYVCTEHCDRVQVYFRSGQHCNCKRLTNCSLGNNMCANLEKAIMLLLADLLPMSECGDCTQLLSQIDYWQNDFAVRANNVSYSVPFNLLDNPFGTTRGAIGAWKIVKDLQESTCQMPLSWTNNL